MNIAQHVEHGAQLFSERLALCFEGATYSYAQLNGESNRVANSFAGLAIGRGDRVAIWLPNSAAFVFVYLGIQKLGAIAVTINTALKAEEIAFILKDSGAQLLITTAALYSTLAGSDFAAGPHIVLTEGEHEQTLSLASLCQQAAVTYTSAAMAATDPAVLLYTSGTTGFPKGALLSHGAVLIAAQTAINTFDLRATDRVLLALSMFHSFAQTAALVPALAAGATLLLHRQFELEPVLTSIQTQAATYFFGVPTLYILLLAQASPIQLQSVRRYISAGAALPVTVAQQWHAKYGTVINEGYGLTEICLGTFNHEPLSKPGSVGCPLTRVRLCIVDEVGELVAPGELGEILVDSPSVMLGYWQRPTESAAVLRAGWFYTGDIGRMDADGYYYIVDRSKDMVNVGGVKVYPSEVENILYQHPAVSEVAVYGVQEALLGEQVQANIVLKPGHTVTSQALFAFCRERLAEFKLPSVINFVDQLPKSRTGKILKRLLREQAQPSPSTSQANGQANRQVKPLTPATTSHQHAIPGKADEAALTTWLAAWLADQLQIEVHQIDREQPFADYGLTSIIAVKLARALGEWLGQPIPATLLWNFPTIGTLVDQLVCAATHPASTANPLPAPPNNRPFRTPQVPIPEPIALVGIGCRFPGGANTPEQFWQLLRNGVDTVGALPVSRWPVDQYYDSTPHTPGKMIMRAGSFLEGIEHFDAQFFGIPPLEAATIDPQQRLLLEVAWEALEHANLAADQLRESRTGVYVGAFWDDYSAHHLYQAEPDQIDSYRLLSHLRGMSAGRLAYLLGFHGPAMQLDTACSSSLLAVHLACQALRSGECDLALAGGVNLVLAPEQLIGLSHMGAVAPDGRCKTFAAEADGFGVGEGVGLVVLKRLADAVSAGDRILAVIRGSAVNHDGASNGLTAPNGRAQEAMLRQALANAAVRPAQIQYVETHGTGTVLGDPIEVQALLNVLGPERAEPLWLGSVKTNIGHLSAAAGIAALTKVALALQAGEIPPNLHFTTPNPHIPWATAPLAVPTAPMAWPPAVTDATDPSSGRRLAGVSSFGLTGTNVHLIVEEAPPTHHVRAEKIATQPAEGDHTQGYNGTVPAALATTLATAPAMTPERPYHMLTLSAKSEQALAAQVKQIEGWLATAAGSDPQARFADICYTAATSRTHWGHRLSIIAPDRATALAKLRQAQVESTAPGIVRSRPRALAPKIAFLFPGQGPQYGEMGRQLYATQPRFRRTLNDCAEILRDYLDQPLLEVLYGADKAQTDARLNQATYAQPALFALEYALATLWRSWGVEPTVVIGHSLGEYAAACLAGVFNLEDGLKLVATRGRLMQTVAPPGQMVAVLGQEAEVRRLLAPYAEAVSLAAINTPQSLVIAGSPTAIQAAGLTLQQAGIETRPLKIYVASHSPLMEPILEQFAAVAATVTYHAPQLQVISNVTGALAHEELTTADYWCRHLREPVQFAQGMATLAQLGIDTFVETGPKATLIGLGQQNLPESDARCWLSSIHPKAEEWMQLMESLATLHGRGATIDWQGFDQPYRRTKVDLPRYPFQRQRYWLDDEQRTPVASPPPTQAAQVPMRGDQHPLLGRQVHSVLTARNQEVLFEQRVDLATLPYLTDHLLFDQPLLPGAAYFEMILAASAHFWPHGQAVLTECAIQQGLFLPMPVPDNQNQATGEQQSGATVQVLFSPAAGGYDWQIYSLADGAPPAEAWTLHATGKLTNSSATLLPPAPLDFAMLQARCQTRVDVASYEQHLRDHGITYGPTFQALAQLFVGTDEALGEVTLPATLAATAGPYHLHPVVLDAALRVASSLWPTDTADLYLPFGVEAFHLYEGNRPRRLWSYVQRRHDEAQALPGTQQVDITIADEAGQVVAHLRNFTLRRANRQALLSKQRRLDWLYTLAWHPVNRASHSPFAHAPGRWLILADRLGYGAALARQLTAQGAHCVLHYQADSGMADGVDFPRLLADNGPTPLAHSAQPLQGVVYLWGLDSGETVDAEVPNTAYRLSTQVLQLVQALGACQQSPRLWLITQQAVTQAAGVESTKVQVQQAPLWGLGRTLQWEEPALACTCVDLPAGGPIDALFNELWFADGENQVLLRGETRLGARLVRHQAQTTQALRLESASCYLITGGLGGLGLQVAQWLVTQGARQLVLAGRNGVTTPAAQAAIQQMSAAGAQISVVQADIADQAAVTQLIAACQQVAPLRGIIHAAGVIDDGLLFQQTAARFAAVMAPKVFGSWHLHTQTRALALDFFVTFSSVSALLGNRGQSNYAAANAFMDALAYQRQQEGRAALSINWGGWSDVGLAATLVQETAERGLGAISPQQGVDLLGLLLTGQAPQVGVLPMQWQKFQQSLPAQITLPMLSALIAPSVVAKDAPALRQQLANSAAAGHYGVIKEHVQTLLLKLLGATPAADESFLLFGLDSLMSIQLANRLAAALGITLPSTLAFKYETIDRLTQYLLETWATAANATGNGAESPTSKAPVPAALTEWYPQLYNQRECYLWHEEVANKACLHVQQSVYIHSPVDPEHLAAALQLLVDRHEALRTVYTRRGTELLQRTLATQSVDFAVVDLVQQDWQTRSHAMLAAAQEPFDLAQGPLLRGRLYRHAADDQLFLLVVHHIAADATALSVIINELWLIYGALQRGHPIPLPPVKTDWRDFVRWQTDRLQGAEGARLWRYWQNQLAGDLPRLLLPTDYPRPARDSHHGRPCTFAIDTILLQQLRHLAQREGCTLYMVLMAAFQLLLHRYSTQRDLIVAAHVANRNEEAFAEIVGYLADTFAIRTQIPVDATFLSILHQVQPTILAAMEHQGFPLRLLAERLGVAEHPSQTVLAQVWFTLLPLRLFQESGALFQSGSGAINLGGLTLEAVDLIPAWLGAWYDLEMILTEGDTTVFGTLVYKTELFTEATILQLIADFKSVLATVVADPTQPVALPLSDGLAVSIGAK